MLSPFEKMRVRDLLRGPAADAFVRAAAAFAANPTDAALRRLDGILRPHDCAKWTVVTYLPFLWSPEAHLFLKAEVTKDYAVRVGHSFAEIYEGRLIPAVYRSLLDLAERTQAEVADLKPRDLIDIQSFIWTAGATVTTKTASSRSSAQHGPPVDATGRAAAARSGGAFRLI